MGRPLIEFIATVLNGIGIRTVKLGMHFTIVSPSPVSLRIETVTESKNGASVRIKTAELHVDGIL